MKPKFSTVSDWIYVGCEPKYRLEIWCDFVGQESLVARAFVDASAADRRREIARELRDVGCTHWCTEHAENSESFSLGFGKNRCIYVRRGWYTGPPFGFNLVLVFAGATWTEADTAVVCRIMEMFERETASVRSLFSDVLT